MIYRDELEKCPRCGTELVTAGSARGCTTCAGVWVHIGAVEEMTMEMQTPPFPSPLPFEQVARQPLPCPTCSEPMDTVNVYGVPLDRCAKKHGIWFDAHELAAVLLRSVKPQPT